MASKQTSNFGLNQWELSDGVVMEDFNADNRAVDAALQELKSSIPQICCGSYVGSGVALTKENPKVITVGFRPKLVIMTEVAENAVPRLFLVHYGQTVYRPVGTTTSNSHNLQLIWGENSLSWYTSSDFTFDRAGITYSYLVIG